MTPINPKFIELGEIYRFRFTPAGASSQVKRYGEVLNVGVKTVTFKRLTRHGETWSEDRMEIIDGVETIVSREELMIIARTQLHGVVPQKLSFYYGELLDHDDPYLEKDRQYRK